MTLSNSDENTRADWIENALIIYFSHPAVEGVILWGFWDEFSDPDSSLVNGNYFYVSTLTFLRPMECSIKNTYDKVRWFIVH